MPRDDLVELEGTVESVQRGDVHRVAIEGGHVVTAHRCSKMVLRRVRCVIGDRVKVAVSPFDPARGIIRWRH